MAKMIARSIPHHRLSHRPHRHSGDDRAILYSPDSSKPRLSH